MTAQMKTKTLIALYLLNLNETRKKIMDSFYKLQDYPVL